MTITLVIPGPVVPYTRVGRERWTDRAHRYLAWRDAFAAELAAQAPRPQPVYAGGPVEIVATFIRNVRRGDLDNLLKGVMDAANGVLWTDDGQVVALRAALVSCQRGEDTTVVTTMRPVAPTPPWRP